MAKTYKFDSYLAEARPTAFELELSQDDKIVIEAPDVETLLKLDEARSARRMLQLLCGEHYGRIHSLVKDKHSGVLEGLVRDMRAHFNLDAEPPGGSRAS